VQPLAFSGADRRVGVQETHGGPAVVRGREKEHAMGIGVGIALLVVGLILVTGAVDVPQAVNDVVATGTVGWICLIVGVLALVLSVVLAQQRSRSTHVVEERRYDA
jgi:uncharacterized integral membrane protein